MSSDSIAGSRPCPHAAARGARVQAVGAPVRSPAASVSARRLLGCQGRRHGRPLPRLAAPRASEPPRQGTPAGAPGPSRGTRPGSHVGGGTGREVRRAARQPDCSARAAFPRGAERVARVARGEPGSAPATRLAASYRKGHLHRLECRTGEPRRGAGRVPWVSWRIGSVGAVLPQLALWRSSLAVRARGLGAGGCRRSTAQPASLAAHRLCRHQMPLCMGTAIVSFASEPSWLREVAARGGFGRYHQIAAAGQANNRTANNRT